MTSSGPPLRRLQVYTTLTFFTYCRLTCFQAMCQYKKVVCSLGQRCHPNFVQHSEYTCAQTHWRWTPWHATTRFGWKRRYSWPRTSQPHCERTWFKLKGSKHPPGKRLGVGLASSNSPATLLMWPAGLRITEETEIGDNSSIKTPPPIQSSRRARKTEQDGTT